MPDGILTTQAEKLAEKALVYPVFDGVSLLHVKRELTSVLGLIGRGGIFDEYTRHDVSHIDVPLRMLDWLIPQQTKAIMSPADWLLVVLAVYFHDVGMLVTSTEYKNRSAEFRSFRDDVLFGGDNGADYKSKVESLPEDQIERFLYQEFVRHKHPERIKNWVTGKPSEHLGVAHAVMSEIETLLHSLPPLFRRDLALVCESHHLEDLGNLDKYPVSQPYGNSPEETANVQFAAILLRTVDLLHMTNDRAPSVAFRLINPTDPISQQEWSRHMAVSAVRPQIGRNRDGIPDESAPQDTIEVFAYFKDENGFFGLTSYISYANDQIQKSYDWVQSAIKLQSSSHSFPWRTIDDSRIETQGFIGKQFEFSIDQPKILDLLTGHTLYNDTGVVLRELIQNSIDAVRFQRYMESSTDAENPEGKICIEWDSAERVLTIEDNGTGMTQEIIERHLLKVGSSRYQDEDFQRENPGFSPISRFGIGVLSAFMVADSVEIITCHPDDEQARYLTLRSVHGKYLIRLLDKFTDETVKRLMPHGTYIRLRLRESAELSNILDTAKMWVVVPGCLVSVKVDDAAPIFIGFSSPREALEDILISNGGQRDGESLTFRGETVRIDQRSVKGVDLAYALRWSSYFREWTFLQTSGHVFREGAPMRLGTCVEGIRVQFNSPGFDGNPIFAIANATGSGVPRTNVARSSLETTPEFDAMLGSIYRIYCDHVGDEIQKLHRERSFSLTWATREANILLLPLIQVRTRPEDGRPQNSAFLLDEMRKLPVVLIETDSKRNSISPLDLDSEENFWTVDCALFQNAEYFIREIPGNTSVSTALNAFQAQNIELPNGPMICGVEPNRIIDADILSRREVDMIHIHRDDRRVDVRWANCGQTPRWKTLRFREDSEARLTRRRRSSSEPIWIYVATNQEIEVKSLDQDVAVKALGRIYIPFESSIFPYAKSLIEVGESDLSPVQRYVYAELLDIFYRSISSASTVQIEMDEEELNQQLNREINFRDREGRSPSEILSTIGVNIPNTLEFLNDAANRGIFDPAAWIRGEID